MPGLKNRHAPLFVLLGLTLVCAGVWVAILHPQAKTVADLEPEWLTAALSPADSSRSKVKALVGAEPLELALASRSQTKGCSVVGLLPDPHCSPGAVFVDATTSVICVAGYTKGVRSVSVKLKRQVYAAYDISYPQKTGTYELDHIIPLELGGNNDAANLFPEAGAPAPGFKEKDVVEDYLHQEVCAGRLTLPQAQAQIAQDWTAVYNLLSSDIIKEIRGTYRSWAD